MSRGCLLCRSACGFLTRVTWQSRENIKQYLAWKDQEGLNAQEKMPVFHFSVSASETLGDGQKGSSLALKCILLVECASPSVSGTAGICARMVCFLSMVAC